MGIIDEIKAAGSIKRLEECIIMLGGYRWASDKTRRRAVRMAKLRTKQLMEAE